MNRFFLSCFLLVATIASGQQNDEARIRQILASQTEAWNNGDVDGFMKGYWKSDSLMFIGKNGVTRGWRQTFQNYKQNYPDTATMGKLSFDLLSVKKLSPEYFL